MARAKLTYADASDTLSSLSIKFPSDGEGGLGIAEALVSYGLEVRFYQDIAPLLPDTSLPKCYFAQLDSRFVACRRFVIARVSLRIKTNSNIERAIRE